VASWKEPGRNEIRQRKTIARPAGRGVRGGMLVMAGSVCWGGGKHGWSVGPRRERASDKVRQDACRRMSRSITAGPGVDDGRERELGDGELLGTRVGAEI